MTKPVQFLALFCTIFLGAATQATTIASMSLKELVSAADVVARVRCLGNESRWEGGEIWTFTRFEVLETMKGAAPPTLITRLPGGRVGHIVATVDAAPRFRPGEEVVLFLERKAAGDFSVTSWTQGTFRIRRGVRADEESVTQDSCAYMVFDPATHGFVTEGIRLMPWKLFRAQLASAIGRAREGRLP